MFTIELILVIIALLLAMQTAMQSYRGPYFALTNGGVLSNPELWELSRLRAQINNCFGGKR